MTRVAMMGSGSWGTACHGARARRLRSHQGPGPEDRRADHDDPSKPHVPPGGTPGRSASDLTAQEALQGADYVVLAIPSQVVRANVSH